jgi:hypothetical protein
MKRFRKVFEKAASRLDVNPAARIIWSWLWLH